MATISKFIAYACEINTYMQKRKASNYAHLMIFVAFWQKYRKRFGSPTKLICKIEQCLRHQCYYCKFPHSTQVSSFIPTKLLDTYLCVDLKFGPKLMYSSDAFRLDNNNNNCIHINLKWFNYDNKLL